jgi:tetratricopeptide (TPR) repeat protein
MMEIIDLRAALDAARSALTAARYDDAMELLRGCQDWPVELAEHAVLVKADTLIRRDAPAALAWLAATQDLVITDKARFDRELLTGRAYSNVRNFDAAASRFARAAKLLDKVPEGSHKLAFMKARLAWMLREATPDNADLAHALADPDPIGRALSYAQRGHIYGSAGNFAAQIADLKTALEIAETTDVYDVEHVGTAVYGLATIAFEVADKTGVATARHAYEWLKWTADVRVNQYNALRCLGWDAFMRGEPARAQWLFHDAAAIAPTPAWQAQAHLDRAYVARISKNDAWSLDELHEALRIAQGVAWGETIGEERLTLVTLAVLLAPVNVPEAQRYAATYAMFGMENINPYLVASHDRRTVGFGKYTQGKIEQTLGNPDLAQESLEAAYAIFAPIGHHYQAMLAAQALADVTKDAVWADKASMHSAAYPGSPLTAQVAESAKQSDPAIEGLTPLQRQLARAHWSGLNVDDLSKQFSRSMYTIEGHIADIYAAFNVATAGGLREEALRRGIA